jgi:hypothetical protein
MIPIGAYPITCPPSFKQMMTTCEYTRKYLLDNIDLLYKANLRQAKMFKFAPTLNKYANLAYLIAFGSGLRFR